MMIAVIDYGSQYTQLIARKFRRLGYLASVLPSTTKAEDIQKMGSVKGLVLSGSPSSVSDGGTPDVQLLDLGIPILGICYGFQFLAQHFGGACGSDTRREYGATIIEKNQSEKNDPMLKGIPESCRVWMSHGDHVESFPKSAKTLLTARGHPVAFAMPEKKIWALQFHP
jgi:GMP synthase (glutamine-hydrolysing)